MSKKKKKNVVRFTVPFWKVLFHRDYLHILNWKLYLLGANRVTQLHTDMGLWGLLLYQFHIFKPSKLWGKEKLLKTNLISSGTWRSSPKLLRMNATRQAGILPRHCRTIQWWNGNLTTSLTARRQGTTKLHDSWLLCILCTQECLEIILINAWSSLV